MAVLLKRSLKSPLFYITALLFALFTAANFFFRNQFFSAAGTTDLVLFFSAVPYISILAVPALCYKQSFTVYDDFIPQGNSTRIIRRFLCVLVQFCLLLALLLPSVLMVQQFGSTDAGQVLTGFLCLILYGASVISLCIFLTEMCGTGITAFVISAVVLAALNGAHLAAVYVSRNSAFTAVCRQLSFAWHFDAAGKGILDTRDVVWLLGAACLFLRLAVLARELKAGKRFCAEEKRRELLLCAITVLIMLNGTRWFVRLDFSEGKTFSLSRYSKELASNLDSALKITYYRSSSLARLYPQVRDVSDFLTSYAALDRHISLTITDPDKDSGAARLLADYGIESQQLRSERGNATEYLSVYSAVVLEYLGNALTIPAATSAQSLEYDMDSRVKQLISGRPRVVNIINGNGLDFYEDYGYALAWLGAQDFSRNLISAGDPSFSQRLSDAEGPLLVLGDSVLGIEQAAAIENYILGGRGNALLAVSPYSVDIAGDWSVTENTRTNLVELAEHWGVTFLPQIAADISCSRITMYSDDASTELINYPFWIQLLHQQNCPAGMTLFWAVPLALDGTSARPYLVSSPSGYAAELDHNSPKRLLETNPFYVRDSIPGRYQTLVLAAKITGPLTGLYTYGSRTDAQVLVIPDQYFVNSLMTEYNAGEYGDARNFQFLTTELLALNGETELAALQAKSTRDSSLYKITDAAQFIALQRLTILVTLTLVPLLVLTAGAAVFIQGKIHAKK